MASKNDKPTDARAAAKAKAQQQVKAKERRTTVIIIAASLIVIAAFAGVVYFIVNSAKVPALPDAHAPAPADENGGIPVGTTGIAGQDVPSGTVRLDLYIDLMCPVCNQFEQINADDITSMREAGEIAVYYHPISILDRVSSGTNYSTRAANAVAVVADQDPEHFLDFIAALYDNQPEENSTGLDDATIASIAVGVGVPSDVADSFKDGEFTKWVTSATDQASQDGMQGTPTLRVAAPGQTFDEGRVLDPNSNPDDPNYFTAGALKAYLESLSGATPAPTASS
jgi:protein-disulfide isomerase